MILFVDNYDSFSYMLVDYLKQLDIEPVVIRNDEWTLEEVKAAQPKAIIISPGPTVPAKSGVVLPLIQAYYQQVPILGICLGHQAIGEFFGAKLERSEVPIHGKTAVVKHYNHPVFEGVPSSFQVMRYHSLELRSVPDSLTVTCQTTEGIVMGIQHRHLPITGFQFHPESILTQSGLQLLHNWVSLYIAVKYRQ